ncbi:MAG: cation:proton antiporter [Deltaproteobacteria bacterium]|nr:cation:proton antiporter [Deltaproteobacteria bacterium]
MDAYAFLKALAAVLTVAGVTTVLFQRLRQPVVLGYLLAGLIVGPHVPVPLVADPKIVRTLSEVGVILLMFSLGLEFNLRKLFQVGPTGGLTAIVECSFMVWLGSLAGTVFGWTRRECLFAGAVIAISSTSIVSRAFEEQGVRGNLRDRVVGILIVEDLIAVLLLAVLTAVATGAAIGPGALAATVWQLAAFLLGLLAVGLLVVPRFVRAVCRLDRPETTLVASVGLCFATAVLAHFFGYSVALGAFIAGSLAAESGEEEKIETVIRPVRDLFAAIFFVSVGMSIDPALILENWVAVAVLVVLVIVGKTLSVSFGAFLTGAGIRSSLQSGMSLAQIGEFSFIIAGLGVSFGAIREFMAPVAVAVSALTAVSTPWLIRASVPVASFVDRKLPRPLQTFGALYGSWLEHLGARPGDPKAGHRVVRLVKLLFLDATLLGTVLIGTSLAMGRIAGLAVERTGVPARWIQAFLVAAAGILCAPLCLGVYRSARRLGLALAELALPAERPGRLDLAAAPREALVVTLQLGALLMVELPLLAVTQPFLPRLPAALLFAAPLVFLAASLWRSAEGLQGHVRAGAQVIVEALAAQRQRRTDEAEEPGLGGVRELLPGLGDPVPLRLGAESPAVGRTLADLDLRGITGATVLAIFRAEEGLVVPNAKESLREGDVLALAGTQEAVEAAKRLLS